MEEWDFTDEPVGGSIAVPASVTAARTGKSPAARVEIALNALADLRSRVEPKTPHYSLLSPASLALLDEAGNELELALVALERQEDRVEALNTVEDAFDRLEAGEVVAVMVVEELL